MATRERRRAYIYFAIAGSVVLAVLAGNLALRMQDRPDANDCIGHPSRKTVILIDHTDNVAIQTREEILQRALSHVTDRVQQGELVSVFIVDDFSARNLAPAFSRCKPADRGNPIYQSDRALKAWHRKAFSEPLKSALAKPIGTSSFSPIAEAILDLSQSGYLRTSESTHLLIFSDLLQHTRSFSMYSCKSGEEGVAQFSASRIGNRQRPQFKNLAVELHLIPRAGLSESTVRCRDYFWLWFFGDNDGPNAGVDIDYLPGPG